MKQMPAPNSGNLIFDNYLASGSGGFNTDQFDARGDDQLTQKFHTFGRYTRFSSNLNGAPIFGAAGGSGRASQRGVARGVGAGLPRT